MESPIISICIPTKDRIEILRKTLNSIYSSNTLNFEEFEVVISDNSESDELQEVIVKEYEQISNIHYYKSQQKGFLNSISALEFGKGKLLKLHNDYTMFSNGSLERLISFVKDYMAEQPFIFFSQGILRNQTIKEYNCFNDFVFDLSYWITWSTAFSIWREDFLKLKNKEIDSIFPHTSLLFFESNKEKFVVNNLDYFKNQNIPSKGGYNLFYGFSVIFLRMLEKSKLNNDITQDTFSKIKKDLYYKFLMLWYYNTKVIRNKYSYDMTNIKSSICTYYTMFEYIKLILLAYLLSIKKVVRKIH